MAIKLFTFCCFALAFLSCDKNSREISELRYYSVLNIPDGDTIWIDTIYQNTNAITKNPLSRLIHSIDSAISMTPDSLSFRDLVIIPKTEFTYKEHKMIKYYAGLEVEHGTLSFYGIYLRGFGTVYWRWLDGHKALLIKESRIDNRKQNYTDLALYLNEVVNAVPKLDTMVFDTEYGLEDSFDLKLDTTLLKLK